MNGGLIYLIFAFPLAIPVILAFIKSENFSRRSILFFKNKAALIGVLVVALLAVLNLVLYQFFVWGECRGGIDSGFVCTNYTQSSTELLGGALFIALIYLMFFGAPALVLLLIAEIQTRLFQKK